MTKIMDDCIFCKIIRGELPAYKVYEDDKFLGFLDIYPRAKGHTLLIPKKHYHFVYDVPEFDKYWLAALKVTHAMQKAFKPLFVTYLTHGLEVPHAHIHIVPRAANDIAFFPEIKKISKEEMTQTAEKLKNAVNSL